MFRNWKVCNPSFVSPQRCSSLNVCLCIKARETFPSIFSLMHEIYKNLIIISIIEMQTKTRENFLKFVTWWFNLIFFFIFKNSVSDDKGGPRSSTWSVCCFCWDFFDWDFHVWLLYNLIKTQENHNFFFDFIWILVGSWVASRLC